jgi:hypothetical protein
MPIVNKEQLQHLKDVGWKVAGPQQGLNSVPEGLAETAKIDLSEYPDAHFFQLVFDVQCQVFIVLTPDAIEFARHWIEENINLGDYKLLLQYDCYIVAFDDHSGHSSILVRPFGAKLDYAAEVINQSGGTITFDLSNNSAPIKIEYKTKSQSHDPNQHLAEIETFATLVSRLFEAASFITGYGFTLVGKDIIDPRTMWQTGRTQGSIHFDKHKVGSALDELTKESSKSGVIKVMAEMNSITSHRAQIVYGYEAIISLLSDEIKKQRGATFSLGKVHSKTFKTDLAVWIKDWLINNRIEYDDEHIECLELNQTQLLNGGAQPGNKECTLNVLASYLDKKDHDSLGILYKMRNAFAHNRRDVFTPDELSSSLELLRKLLTRI